MTERVPRSLWGRQRPHRNQPNLEAVAADASALSDQGATDFQEAAGRIAAAVNGFIQGKAEAVSYTHLTLPTN